MSNEFINLFELQGDSKEIKKFIDEHTRLTKFTNCEKIWDTHDFIEKNLTKNEKNTIFNSTGGRIKSSTTNTLVLYNTSPIDECIRHIIKFYINITLKYSYYDVNKEILYGWMYCKNGKVLDQDQIMLEKKYPLIINNTFEIIGNQQDINNFINIHLDLESKKWDFGKSISLIENDPILTWGCKNPIKTEIQNNKIILETIDSPPYLWFKSIIKKYNFRINYKYLEVLHKNFYGYYISEDKKILSKDFINLNFYNEKYNLYKFKTLEEYLEKL